MAVQLKIGGDPEFFLKDTKTGEHVSAHDIVPGTKKEPFKVKGGAVQHDGTAVEINLDPATSGEQFKDTIHTVLDEVRKMVPKKYEFDYSPVVYFKQAYFKALPDEVKELGCDPDYSGITGERNRQPMRSKSIYDKSATMCTGAGHLALGWRDDGDRYNVDHMYDCQQLSRRLNLYFHAHTKHWDIDQARQALYGANAPYRPKSFGVEYRALSNAWLGQPSLWPWLFDSCAFVFNHALDGGKVNEQYYNIQPFDLNYTTNYTMKYRYKATDRLIYSRHFTNGIFGKMPPPLPTGFVPIERVI